MSDMQKQRMIAGREIIRNAPIQQQAPALLKWTEYMPSLFVGYELLKRFEKMEKHWIVVRAG
jgi:hypothetical protein